MGLQSMTRMIPVIELKGSPAEMGAKFGETYKTEIKELAETRMQRLINFTKKYGKVDITSQEVLDMCSSLLPVHQNYDQDIWDEFSNIARSADISLEWLLVANGYTDLRDYVCKTKGFNDKEVRFEGCTAFLLDKTMSSESNILLGQTWDMSVEAMKYLVIVKKNDDMVYLTTMGCLALIGINKHGLAIGTTNLMANDAQEGINYLFTISKALQADIYTDMLSTVIGGELRDGDDASRPLDKIYSVSNNAKRMSGHSFLCIDNNTRASLVECSAQSHTNYQLDHYPLVQTNHYNEIMRQHEIFIPEARRRNSVFRQSRAMNILVNKSKWSKHELWEELLADTHRSDSGGAICNEDYNGQYGEFATLATIILDTKNREIMVCRGGAASGETQSVAL